MFICFHPCSRRARWRRRQLPRPVVNLLIAAVCLGAFVALLFLAPQWVLVVAVVVLLGAILCLCRQ
ncbi:MAG: hypothetical protein IJM20_03925 [Clostridia bacterium]|nr:hypothetical protein [Clostridia bacterium]